VRPTIFNINNLKKFLIQNMFFYLNE